MSQRMGVDIYTLAIVKGMVENQDPYRHFGSTLGFKEHKRIAIEAGYIQDHPKGGIELTTKGRRLYHAQDLEHAHDTRAYFWVTTNWWKGP